MTGITFKFNNYNNYHDYIYCNSLVLVSSADVLFSVSGVIKVVMCVSYTCSVLMAKNKYPITSRNRILLLLQKKSYYITL